MIDSNVDLFWICGFWSCFLKKHFVYSPAAYYWQQLGLYMKSQKNNGLIDDVICLGFIFWWDSIFWDGFIKRICLLGVLFSYYYHNNCVAHTHMVTMTLSIHGIVCHLIIFIVVVWCLTRCGFILKMHLLP